MIIKVALWAEHTAAREKKAKEGITSTNVATHEQHLGEQTAGNKNQIQKR